MFFTKFDQKHTMGPELLKHVPKYNINCEKQVFTEFTKKCIICFQASGPMGQPMLKCI